MTTADAIRGLHERRSANRNAITDALAVCLRGAEQGRLFAVDTLDDGLDSLVVADDEASAVETVADLCGRIPEGWTAERITLARGAQ